MAENKVFLQTARFATNGTRTAPFDKTMSKRQGWSVKVGDSSQAASLSPGPFPLPRTATMADWYWITMAGLMGSATFLLLWHIVACEKRATSRMICIRRRRYKRSTLHVRSTLILRPLIFTLLLLSQHIGHGDGLQLPPSRDVEVQAMYDTTPLSLLCGRLDACFLGASGPAGIVWTDPFAALPPPGNTRLEDLRLRDLLTSFGSLLCAALDARSALAMVSGDGLPSPVSGFECTPVKETVRLADHLPDDMCTARGALSGSPCLPILSVSPPSVDQPGSVSTTETFHLPDQDPPASENHVCKLPFSQKDTDDLFDEWARPGFVDLSGVPGYNKEVHKVLQFPFVHADDDTELYIYTDGSYDKHSQVATWAFVVFALKNHQIFVRDWFADFLVTDPLNPLWIGATQVGIRGAEASALIYAILYTLQCHRTEQIRIFSDALVLVRSTTGHWMLHDDDVIGANLRAVFLAVTVLRTGLKYDLQHVKSHSGIIGNEFADFLAVGVREHKIDARPIPRSYDFWFQGTDPNIRHVWFFFDAMHRQTSLPCISADNMSWTAPKAVSTCDWLPCKPMVDKPPSIDQLELSVKCVQYNVCTLRKPGATSYMREQLEFHGVHLAAFQETRTPSAEIQDSNYIRFISPAIDGHGGSELWFSRTLPFGKRGNDNLFFTRDQFTVVHAEPEVLCVVLTVFDIEFFIVSAHAPHRAHQAPVISTWWQRLRQVLETTGLRRRLLLFIDANAHVGPQDPWIGDHLDDFFDTAGYELLTTCRDFSLCLPSTFASIHHGAASTWHCTDSPHSEIRIDYICSSWDAQLQWVDTWCDMVLDPGHAKLDHIPLFGRFTFSDQATSIQANIPKFDRERIAQASAADWQNFFHAWPEIHWNVSPTEHALIVEQHLHKKIARSFSSSTSTSQGFVFQ